MNTFAIVQLILALIALVFTIGNVDNRLPLWPAVLFLAIALIISVVR